jgi:signal peptidase I
VEKLRKLWKNEYFQTVLTIALMIIIVFGFWYGLQVMLNTPYPALTVASGSMCMQPGPNCDGWSHPFEPTLHVGDLIIVQGVNPEDIKAEPYPNGDIIVFRKLQEGDLVVHRAIAKEKKEDGKWYFQTKGDGNSSPDSPYPNIPEDYVIGRVVMRIPWVGHLALFLHNSSGIFIIMILIVILLIVELVIPAVKGKSQE